MRARTVNAARYVPRCASLLGTLEQMHFVEQGVKGNAVLSIVA